MGRNHKKRPKEGKRQSTKKLTANHEEFMKSRNADRKEEKETGKEDFDSFISKTIKQQ
jgi:hypothetical protein